MSSKAREGHGGPPPKRVRLAEPSDAKATITKKTPETKAFDGVPAIQAALGANGGQPSTGLVETLTALRNQLSLRHNEIQTLIDTAQSTATTSSKGLTSGSYLNSLSAILPPTDSRLLLLEKWCSSSPGLEELFAVWDAATTSGWSKGPANSMNSTISALVMSVLTSILGLLSAHYPFHAHAHLVLKHLFENERWRRICGYATSSSNDLILGALKLLTVVVEKWDAKKVFDGFVWESKNLTKLLQMRRKGTIVKPDIRTAYILFLISFLLPSANNSQTKAAFLQQYGFHYTSLFKNLHQDSPAVVRRVLEVSWEGVWCDIKVSRSVKVGAFAAGGILSNLLKLYERTEEEEGGFVIADLVHHFLLAICTRPGVGLCFKDHGWYPRDVGGETLFNDDEEEESATGSKPKIYNPTLLILLKQLKPTDDPRQNELALKILHVAPELVSMYLPQSGLTLDPPRLSSKWIANLCFFVSVLGGTGSVEDIEKEGGFKIEAGYRPTPPPLSTIVNNITPGGGVNRLNMRNVFTKGLQFVPASSNAKSGATGNLVQHTTALGLIRCLNKLRRVREAMEGVSTALGEGQETFDDAFLGEDDDTATGGPKEGLWAKRAREVLKEVRRRLPEFQVVLAFCTAHLKTTTTATAAVKDVAVVEDVSEGEKVKKELMAECAMRLLWMYQEALPEVVEEARFDVGKVLVGLDVSSLREPEAEDDSRDKAADEGETATDDDGEAGEEKAMSDDDNEEGHAEPATDTQAISTQTRLRRLTQLHIVRFLCASPTFSFSAPSPNHPGHTHIYSLLLGIVRLGAVRDEISEELRKLVSRVLGRSIVFNWAGTTRQLGNADAGEVEAWIDSLPIGLRRVRQVKRLVDVNNEGEDEEMASGESGSDGPAKVVTVYPETLDGTPLTDERLSVVAFLEDCLLRCAKTPYKYIEELEKMAATAAAPASASAEQAGVVGAALPSPLIVTLVEQLEAKLASQGGGGQRLLAPSDVLAIVTYLRTLVVSLVGKLDGGYSTAPGSNAYLVVITAVLDRCDDLASSSRDVWSKAFAGEKHELVRDAVRRELDIARRCLGISASSGAGAMEVEGEDRDVDDFLDLVEALEIPSAIERRLTIYELVDWVRLLGVPLNQGQTNRLWGAVEEVWPQGLSQVVRYLDVPDVRASVTDGVSVWEVLVNKDGGDRGTRGDVDGMEVDQDDASDLQEVGNDHDGDESEEDGADENDPSSLPFEYLLVHALPRHLLNPDCQEILIESAINYCETYTESSAASTSTTPLNAIAPHKLQDIIRHVLRRFSVFVAIGQTEAAKNLLLVLAGIVDKIRTIDHKAFESTKVILIAGLKELMSPPLSASTDAADTELFNDIQEGLRQVIDVALDPRVPSDRALVADSARLWVERLKKVVESSNADSEVTSDYASRWIRFVQPTEVLALLEIFVARPELLVNETTRTLEDTKVADIVTQGVGLCLRALRDASKMGLTRQEQQDFHDQLIGYPRSRDLLFRTYSLLSTLRTAAGDESKEKTFAVGSKAVEELIAIIQENNGVPSGVGGDPLACGTSEIDLTRLLEDAERSWSAGIRSRKHASDHSLGSSDLMFIKTFLAQPPEEWTVSTEKVVRNFLYWAIGGSDQVQVEVARWLLSEDGGRRMDEVEGGERVIGVAHALIDCASNRSTRSSSLGEDDTVKIFEFALSHLLHGGERKTQAKETLQTIMSSLKQDEERIQLLLTIVDKRLKPLRKSTERPTSDSLTADLITFIAWLTTIEGPQKMVRSIVDDVVEVGIQCFVRALSEEDGQRELREETKSTCAALAKVLHKKGVSCKASSLETLLGVVVQSQYHIAQPRCLEVLAVGLTKASLKPLIVNKYLQGVIQHPHFFKLAGPASSMASSPPSLNEIRDRLVHLLHTLFYLHPANTCQISHIEPLIRVYGGTLSVSDRRILSIFRLFERQRKLSVRAIVGRWAPPSSSLAGSVLGSESIGLESLQNLDPILVLRTGLSFPVWMSVDDDMDSEMGPTSKTTVSPAALERQLYDPIFVLLLLQHVLSTGPPTSAISWVELFRSNVIGLALRALSAREGRLRELGMACIVGLWTFMQNADLQERDHVVYLLERLKNAIPAPETSTTRGHVGGENEQNENEAYYVPRLPSYITLLLFHALRGIFNPSTFVYPLTARFLLQRPELDLTDVPMLYSMLYSSDTDDWKKERGWILRFLADGLLTGSAVADWKLLKRRHVWDLVASMYQGSNATGSAFSLNEAGGPSLGAGDKALKSGVLDFLANVTKHRIPTMSLILKSGLLAWIEMQLAGSDSRGVNGIEWLRILENVLVVIDIAKMEAGAMKGQWARVMGRCVETIVRESVVSPATLSGILPLATRIVVRLSIFNSVGSQALSALIVQCMEALKVFESDLKVPSITRFNVDIPQFDDMIAPPLHTSHGLHDKLVLDDQTHLFVWGRLLELLWQATMNCNCFLADDIEKQIPPNRTLREVWNRLTSRLLVWRRIVGASGSPLGEWARVESVSSLGGESVSCD